MFSTNHFHYGITQSIGDTAIAATLTAARWGVLGFAWYTDTFFSATAARRYRAIGQCIGFAAVVAVALGMTVRIYLQSWVDSEVEGALPDDHIADAGTMVEVLEGVWAMHQRIINSDRPNLITAKWHDMTVGQLRKECQKEGIIWRNANGKNKHLCKGQMITSLASLAISA
jgi:hypothetical protein